MILMSMTKSLIKSFSYRKTDAGRQRDRVVKSVVIVIEIVLIQSLLRSFCCVLGKTLYSNFFCLAILASSAKIQLYFYKTKKPN